MELWVNLCSYLSSKSQMNNKVWVMQLGAAGLGKSYNSTEFFDMLDNSISISVVTPENLLQNTCRENKDGKMLIFGELDELLAMFRENIYIVFKVLYDGNIFVDNKTIRKEFGQPIEYEFRSSIIANINRMRGDDDNLKAIYDRFLFTYYDCDYNKVVDTVMYADNSFSDDDKEELRNLFSSALGCIPSLAVFNESVEDFIDGKMRLLYSKFSMKSHRFGTNFKNMVILHSSLKQEFDVTIDSVEEVYQIFNDSYMSLQKFLGRASRNIKDYTYQERIRNLLVNDLFSRQSVVFRSEMVDFLSEQLDRPKTSVEKHVLPLLTKLDLVMTSFDKRQLTYKLRT